MYIVLTTRCNMTCQHCCFAATNRGVDMDITTFRKALKIAADNDDYITLGGGEPTLHPRFEQFLIEAIGAFDDEDAKVNVITNGKLVRKAMLIAKLTKANVISGELSQDPWHEEIDDKVVETFEEIGAKNFNSRPYIRDVSKNGVIPVGRAKTLPLHEFRMERKRTCACEDLFVTPKGIIRQCGCPRSPVVGNVNDPWVWGLGLSATCYRSEEYKKHVAELKIGA